MTTPPKPGPHLAPHRPAHRPDRVGYGPRRSPHAPPPGPAVALADFARTFDPATVWHSARTRGSFVKYFLGKRSLPDAELTDAIRTATTHLATGTVRQRGDGGFEVTHAGVRWLVTQDCRVIFGVKPVREVPRA